MIQIRHLSVGCFNSFNSHHFCLLAWLSAIQHLASRLLVVLADLHASGPSYSLFIKVSQTVKISPPQSCTISEAADIYEHLQLLWKGAHWIRNVLLFPRRDELTLRENHVDKLQSTQRLHESHIRALNHVITYMWVSGLCLSLSRQSLFPRHIP